MTKLELQNALRLPQFPRSTHYDIDWMVEHEMGPCALWLTEFLVNAMNLQSGMRVLDLGCGKALSSIFLANEFDVQVWATDLWIPASENWGRIVEAKMEHHVFPISAEAHALPYAQGFFDAIVSVDSYHYYGTDELYLGYLSRFVKPEGQIGIIVPGVHEEWTPAAIDRFGEYWDAYNYTFHGPEWWKQLWERSKCVQVTTADVLFRGYEIWLQWDKTLKDAGLLKRHGDVEMLELDGGNLTFTRIVASRA
jgi:cyclopropane fatty-acyl-phospholipid synthase-like methyltransferase